MRIALVSPYSWTYPGGVTRHIEALADELLATGHEVRVLAPYDPDDRHAAIAHRGARPQRRPVPDYLIELGRTVGLPANGAISNVSISPYGVGSMRRELRAGGFDVVHVHEPVAPVLGWDALACAPAPLVGTFHAYSTNAVTNGLANLVGTRRALNKLKVRIAVSEAAAWTGRRFFGGHYRVIPNGVELPDQPQAAAEPADRLRVLFLGQAVERKGLPVALRAFEALRDHIPCELTIVGAGPADVEPILQERRGVRALGKVSEERKHAELAGADVLVAPSLGGESFGMVLTEAFARGTPVVASDIAGYRDVVRDGHDGVLVTPGEPAALAEALRDLWHEPERHTALAARAAASAQRFAWPCVAAQVVEAYEDAIAVGEPDGVGARVAVRLGVKSADLRERAPARRLPGLDPAPSRRHGALTAARRLALVVAALGGLVLATLALRRIGVANIVATLVGSSLSWVLIALGVMCSAMAARAVSWQAILRAAMPGVPVRLRDAMQGTFIGVLMSATLPARLGEPSRALVVARRTGRPRKHLPVVLGTVVSQTLLNVVALAILGAVGFATAGILHGHGKALLVASLAPLALVLLVLGAPRLVGRDGGGQGGLLARARRALGRVRVGLTVFRRPRLGVVAVIAQFGAWGLQWLACYLLLVALGLDHRTGFSAAAAVLFAVNVTAVVPATPSNLGVFQAACVAVLAGAYGVGSADALGYGIILQAVEIATAVIMGVPALVREGLSWKEVKLRALHAAPVTLRPRGARAGAAEPAAVETP